MGQGGFERVSWPSTKMDLAIVKMYAIKENGISSKATDEQGREGIDDVKCVSNDQSNRFGE